MHEHAIRDIDAIAASARERADRIAKQAADAVTRGNKLRERAARARASAERFKLYVRKGPRA